MSLTLIPICRVSAVWRDAVSACFSMLACEALRELEHAEARDAMSARFQVWVLVCVFTRGDDETLTTKI